MKTDNSLFDWSKYGALIRHERTNKGLKNPAEFSRYIFLRTRFEISKDVLYRIEQNRQEPTAMQFLAINLALFGKMWPSYSWELGSCLCREWDYFAENEEPPCEWQHDNLRDFFEENPCYSDDGKKVVFDSDLPNGFEDSFFTYADYLPDDERFELSIHDGEVSATAYARVDDILIC